MKKLLLMITAVCLFMYGACAIAATLYTENFDGPFVERDWVYNNSGKDSGPCPTNYERDCNIENLENVGGVWVPKDPAVPLPNSGGKDAYPWMRCDTPYHKAAAPAGWTAAWDYWADINVPSMNMVWNRGKMGFGRITGQYSYSGASLHMWSSHGNMRLAGPGIYVPMGVYTFKFKSAVYNANSPAANDLWTDWVQWGWGEVNNENPGPITEWPPYDEYYVSINAGWHWIKDPYHDSDPAGFIKWQQQQYPTIPQDPRPQYRPAGEEAGQWHSYSRNFIVPSDETIYMGFNCGHAHDPWNFGMNWATILNVDDLVLEDAPMIPTVTDVKSLPEGSIVQLNAKPVTAVVTEILKVNPSIYIEDIDKTGAIRVEYDQYNTVPPLVGELVYVAGMVRKNECETYIGLDYNGFSIIKTVDYGPVAVQPIYTTCRDLGSKCVRPGAGNNAYLVKITGRVTKVNTDAYGRVSAFYVDDGSRITSDVPEGGVKVYGHRLTGIMPVVNKLVSVVGISTFETYGTAKIRVLRPRDGGDYHEIPEH